MKKTPILHPEAIDMRPYNQEKVNSEKCVICVAQLIIIILFAAYSMCALATTNDNVSSTHSQSSVTNKKISNGDRFAERGLYKAALKEWREAMVTYKTAPDLLKQVELLNGMQQWFN